MALIYTVQLTVGDSIGFYDIYYDSVNSSNLATLVSTSALATNVSLTDLLNGVNVSIPNTSTSIIVVNTGPCDNSITIPISPTAPTTQGENLLCLYYIYNKLNYTWQFQQNGVQNGKPKYGYVYNGVTYTIAWVLNNGNPRWELVINSNLLFVSNNTSDTPDSGWTALGIDSFLVPVIVARPFGCDTGTFALWCTVSSQDQNCNSNATCDGMIVVTPQGGVPNYQYSINGVTYQSSPIFTNVCPGNYVVTTVDDEGSTFQNQVTIVNSATITHYTLTLNINERTVSLTNGYLQKEATWELVCSPQLPVGTYINLSPSLVHEINLLGPGLASYTGQTFVYKNNTLLPSTTSSTSSSRPRPSCASTTTITTVTNFYDYSLQIGNGDTLSGTTSYIMSIPPGTSQTDASGCRTSISYGITFDYGQVRLVGCSCCDVSFNNDVTDISSDSLQ